LKSIQWTDNQAFLPPAVVSTAVCSMYSEPW